LIHETLNSVFVVIPLMDADRRVATRAEEDLLEQIEAAGTIFESLERPGWSGSLSIETRTHRPAYLDLGLGKPDALLE
jgi:hypothetical protein